MSDSVIVLGVCQDHTTARGILRALRRKHLRRSAAIRKTSDGRITVDDNDISLRQGALLGGGIGLLLGFLVGLSALYLAITTIICVIAGSLIAGQSDGGVDDRLVAKYRRLVLQGETLIVVQARPNGVDRVLAILRDVGDDVVTFFVHPPGSSPRKAEDALRKEPFNPERLSAHAARIAAEHEIVRKPRRSQSLLRRLTYSQRSIEYIRHELAQAVRTEQGLATGAEWLLDNAYLVQGQIGEVFRNLPLSYYEELPTLSHGPLAGFPRAYAIAVELIAHTDARPDQDNIVDFLRAYQSIAPLSTGELWAVPLMLRLGLIESVHRLSLKIVRLQRQHEQASFWANRLLNASRRDPDQLLLVLAELARDNPRPEPSFAVRMVGHLHDEAAALVPLQAWLERKLDIALPEILQLEQSRQAADQVSMANAIGSLRFLARLLWQDIFERVSLVEVELSADPAGIYSEMDFATRDRYRHEIEELARWSATPEPETARRVVELARAGHDDVRRGHVGYYLIGAGRPSLELLLGYYPPLAGGSSAGSSITRPRPIWEASFCSPPGSSPPRWRRP